MTELWGNGYEVLADGHESVVLANTAHSAMDDDLTNAYVDEDSAKLRSSGGVGDSVRPPRDEVRPQLNRPPRDEVRPQLNRPPKTFDDYVFQFYIGSLTVVGLYAFFRIMQRSR